MYTIVRKLTVAVYIRVVDPTVYLLKQIYNIWVFLHICGFHACKHTANIIKKTATTKKKCMLIVKFWVSKYWILLSYPTKVYLIWHPSSCQSVALKSDKDKWVNTEFTVYYQVLENLQTSSQLQVFRHKPVKRSQDWPILTSGKIWEVEREANIFKVSGDLHILNYIHFNKLKKDRLIWFAYRETVFNKVFNKVFNHPHNVLHGAQASRPDASAKYVKSPVIMVTFTEIQWCSQESYKCLQRKYTNTCDGFPSWKKSGNLY